MSKPVKAKGKGRKASLSDAGKWYERRTTLLLLLVLITVLVYLPVLNLGFTMLDDTIFIVENQLYNKDLANLVHSFGRGLFNPANDFYYRPIFLVDFILESGGTLIAVEVKSGATFHPDFTTNLSRFAGFAGSDLTHAALIYGGMEAFTFKDMSVVPWNQMSLL